MQAVSPDRNLRSTTAMCDVLGCLPAAIEIAADVLRESPALVLNGRAYWNGDQQERLGRAIREARRKRAAKR